MFALRDRESERTDSHHRIVADVPVQMTKNTANNFKNIV